MWGIIPAAGVGSRIQPLAFSKELLPVGSRSDGDTERPRAVSEHLVDRMILAGARKLCFVISPGKADIVGYYGGGYGPADVCYVVQGTPLGLCDAIFRALPLVDDHEPVVLGLPDTVWFPENGLTALGDGELSLLLFPVARPELFDAVVTDDRGRVEEVQVKTREPRSSWIWGAMRMPGSVLRELHELWVLRDRSDAYLGTLINAYIARGGAVAGVRAGEAYVDVGTLHGYREATRLLEARARDSGASTPATAVGSRPQPSSPILETWTAEARAEPRPDRTA